MSAKTDTGREIVQMIMAAEPDPGRWLAKVVRVALATERVRPERLKILGAVTLEGAVWEVLNEAEKHGLTTEHVLASAVKVLGS